VADLPTNTLPEAVPGLIGGRPLAGRHAVVTGASRGIGAAIADSLARLGAGVSLFARGAEAVDRRASELSARHGGETFAAACDVTDPDSVARAFTEAVGRFGPPAILVNNAGGAKSAPFHRTDDALWRDMLEINLMGAVACCRHALPAMIETGYGRIVNVASTAGLTGFAYVTAYCAAKHALVGFTRALAIETAKKGVTVNAVCPGYTDTDIVKATVANIVAKTGRSAAEARAELAAHNPQGRLIEPAEVAETVAYLCLPSSRAITGQSIQIAGGELM
jgi:NAD(P)-dependent dehydrogenase (short-subunit alcohol dehydrogenase family)